jgi:hypothetical protein
MKPVLALLTLCGLAASLAAPAAPALQRKPNILTLNELRQGWILLFDGQTDFGWAPRGDARWEVVDGTLSSVRGSGAGLLANTTDFPNFHLRLDFWIDDVANSGVFLRSPAEGEITQSNAYEVNIFDRHPRWPTGSINDFARIGRPQRTTGRWNSFDIVADGNRLQVKLNGAPAVDIRSDRYARGPIALQYNGEGQVRFRNIRLRPLGLESVFNGRDLTGWKMIPDRRSVFSVTPQGYLNVTDGPGDLQSTGEYGDFIFQLDVLSNGRHLNSGIFFRAEKDQFWSGYESQIRNQWEGDDRTRPVDFGTGGLYNRQPARRVVSSDHEWFTKTIAAHGRHLAVWVNGIQVSDHVDTREPHASARSGYRANAGVLSIQGHDPATDLSFRNLRIKEMPVRR